MKLNEAMNQGLGCKDKIDLPMGHCFRVENLVIEKPHSSLFLIERG